MALVVLYSELLFPASVLELDVVLPVLPEVAPRLLCCCPAACCRPSASVSAGVHPGNSSGIWGSVGPLTFVGASQLGPDCLPRLNQTHCVHPLCSCVAPAPVLVVFKC